MKNSKGVLKIHIVNDQGMGVFQWCYKIQLYDHQENFKTAWIWFAFATRDFQKIIYCRRLWGHLKFYGTQHYGCGRFQNRPLARLLISSLSLSRVGTFPDLYNRVFEKKRRQLVKKIELDENGLRLVWQEEFLLTTESNIIKLCRVNRQLFEIYLRQTLPPSKYTPREIAQREVHFKRLQSWWSEINHEFTHSKLRTQTTPKLGSFWVTILDIFQRWVIWTGSWRTFPETLANRLSHERHS